MLANPEHQAVASRGQGIVQSKLLLAFDSCSGFSVVHIAIQPTRGVSFQNYIMATAQPDATCIFFAPKQQCIAYSGVVPELLLTHDPSRSRSRVYFELISWQHNPVYYMCWKRQFFLDRLDDSFYAVMRTLNFPGYTCYYAA